MWDELADQVNEMYVWEVGGWWVSQKRDQEVSLMSAWGKRPRTCRRGGASEGKERGKTRMECCEANQKVKAKFRIGWRSDSGPDRQIRASAEMMCLSFWPWSGHPHDHSQQTGRWPVAIYVVVDGHHQKLHSSKFPENGFG